MNKRSAKAIVKPLHKEFPSPKLVFDKSEQEASSSDLLKDIQAKVNESASVSGKVEKLLFKVEKIEEEQGKISKTVGSIHTAIYDPDNGLFSRISSVKSSQQEDKAEIEKQFIELNAWKSQTEKSVTQGQTEDKEIKTKVLTQQNSLENLEKWKTTINSMGKWIFAAIVGGTITILFKMLSDRLGV
jgi:hypothetical protein